MPDNLLYLERCHALSASRWPSSRAVVFRGAGGHEVVHVEERLDPTPNRHQVMVRPSFAGITPAVIAQREGRYPPPRDAPADIPGLEVAGEVVAVDEGVTRWRPGDRVLGLVDGGGLATAVIAHETHIPGIPAELADKAAAAVPEVLIATHDAILQAELRTGELLAVTGANGGVGRCRRHDRSWSAGARSAHRSTRWD